MNPLRIGEEDSAEDGPEAVGAVTDGVAEGEVFPEGEDSDDGGGNGDGPSGCKEDDGNDDGDEDECGEDALPSHREARSFAVEARAECIRQVRIAEKKSGKVEQWKRATVKNEECAVSGRRCG